MESSPNGTRGVLPRGANDMTERPDATDREALQYLHAEIGPILRRERLQPVLRAVKSAVARGELAPLGRLPERQRRALLSAIERRLAQSRRTPSPKVVVRLAARIATAPAPDGRFGRWMAPPAR
jgi:hypothetical protein